MTHLVLGIELYRLHLLLYETILLITLFCPSAILYPERANDQNRQGDRDRPIYPEKWRDVRPSGWVLGLPVEEGHAEDKLYAGQ